MKKTIACILALAILLVLFAGCSQPAVSQETQPATTATEEKGENMLDGKRVLFIGNSYTYYGMCVMEKARGVLDQASRQNDKGYFYQLCKENGAEVAVTNWTFGGHSLHDLFDVCGADRGCDGVNHKAYLTDPVFDYVFIQNGSRSAGKTNEEVLQQVESVMAIFREANPDVQFFFLAHHAIHTNGYSWRSAIKDLEGMGVTVVDWGALVYDLMEKKVEVPGGEHQYFQNTFIISKSESDGYHPNQLTGYLTALFAYCAITGESAVGQSYSFCNDTTVNGKFSFDKFMKNYYTFDPYTNYPDIFASETEMRGLQQLVDQYLAEKSYRNY